VFLEVPDSANITAQAIGRVYRIGQKKQQDIYIVSKYAFYDQKLQAHAAQKIYGQIACQGDLICTEDEIGKAKQELAGKDRDKDDTPATVRVMASLSFAESAIKRAKHNKVIAFYLSTLAYASLIPPTRHCPISLRSNQHRTKHAPLYSCTSSSFPESPN
jgi:hypothetical protein